MPFLHSWAFVNISHLNFNFWSKLTIKKSKCIFFLVVKLVLFLCLHFQVHLRNWALQWSRGAAGNPRQVCVHTKPHTTCKKKDLLLAWTRFIFIDFSQKYWVIHLFSTLIEDYIWIGLWRWQTIWCIHKNKMKKCVDDRSCHVDEWNKRG